MSAIVLGELKAYKAANNSDLSSNGGRMSAVALSDGIVGALFPNADGAERAAGSIKYRKVFWKVDHNGPEALLGARFWQDTFSTGADRLTWFPATQTDTQASITGSERQYGAGVLDVSKTAGATSIDVEVESGQTGLFVNADKVRICDFDEDDVGNEHFTAISGVSQAGSVVTFTIAVPLPVDFAANVTRVSVVMDIGEEFAGSFTEPVVTSGAGTLDTEADPIVLNDKSTIEQTWTLTFTSATAFNISGDTVGAKGSGSVGGGAAPTNTDFSLPYFTLPSAAFGGTYDTGDTIVFTTHPAAYPTWLKRVIPAGAATAARSDTIFNFDGGSA